MIKTKKELAYYLACDAIALGKRKKRPSLFLRGALDFCGGRGELFYFFHRDVIHPDGTCGVVQPDIQVGFGGFVDIG